MSSQDMEGLWDSSQHQSFYFRIVNDTMLTTSETGKNPYYDSI